MLPRAESEEQKYLGFPLFHLLFFGQCLPFLKMTWSQQENLRNAFSCDWRPQQRKMENIQKIWEQNREMNGTVWFFYSSAPRAPSTLYLNATVYWAPQDMTLAALQSHFLPLSPNFSRSLLLWPLTVAQASQLLPNAPHSSLFSKSEMPPLGPCLHQQLFGWGALWPWDFVLGPVVPGSGQFIQFLVLGLSLFHALVPPFSIKPQPQAMSSCHDFPVTSYGL